MEKAHILVVDDEESVIYTLKDILRDHNVTAFTKPSEVLNILKSGEQFDIVLTDFRMHGMNGIDLLSEVKLHLKYYRAILVTAFSSKEILEKGINNELFHKIVNKPFDDNEILKLVDEAMISLRKERDDRKYLSDLQSHISSLACLFGTTRPVLVHSCKVMQDIFISIKKYAPSNANILIEGESGVGKEIVASLIHSMSRRSDKQLIKLNCSSIPEQLFESEFFGYKKGAFTGAISDKPGKFQIADKGTLFLDEVGDLHLNHQAKLLRAIEDLQISPIGSIEPELVDVRVISATNKNLEEMVISGEFRSDLFYRLNIVTIHVPPLRGRKEDIPLLTAFFLADIANKEGQATKLMEKDGFDLISSLPLPGNVRELRNLIYSAFLNTEGDIIRKQDIENILNSSKRNKVYSSLSNLSLSLSELEAEYIRVQLEKNDFSITETARVLGMEQSNFSRKLKKMGISKKNNLLDIED